MRRQDLKEEDIARRPFYTRFTRKELEALHKAAKVEDRTAASYVRHVVAGILRSSGYLA